MTNPIIKIILTDDHPLILEGMAKLIAAQEHMEIAGQYDSGAALIEGLAVQQPLPDILLLDISLPDITGNELVRLIRKQYPAVKIIALTSMDVPYQIKDMMKRGCSGYLLKTSAPSVIIEAIERVCQGEEYLAPGLKERMLEVQIHGHKNRALTNREQQILTLICNGETNTHIAKQLFVSLRTVENHRYALYEKFGVSNTAGLVKVALQQGLIQ
jgi:DNA-binding NarL/FixJ family response regulator